MKRNFNFNFNKISNFDEIGDLKKEWLTTLTSPQDGMWAVFRDSAIHWSILIDDKIIGYAIVNENKEILQFYITQKFLSKGAIIFKTFLDEMTIKSGIVGTNNPSYLSLALNFVKDLKINSYLFTNNEEVNIEEKVGLLKECQPNEIERIVNFYNYSIGAPKEWLDGYIGGLIKKKEIFSLEDDNNIIGTCEVRNNTSAPDFTDIGMVVSPDYRRKGYGSFLLNKAKKIAIAQAKTPICSCEKDNIGSIKSIHNCGFVSKYQLLNINFI